MIKNLSPLIILMFLFSCSSLFAQQENIDTAAFRKIRNAEMGNSHIPWIAHNLTDVTGPRLTNSPGYFRGAKWAIATMKSWGLVNAALEPWGEYGRGWEAEDFGVSMMAPYRQAIIGYAVPWSANTNGTIHAQVMLIKVANLADSAFLTKHAADFAGKIVMGKLFEPIFG